MYAQAISVTSKGFVLSAMVQKDISQNSFEGHGGFHNSAVGSDHGAYFSGLVVAFLRLINISNRVYRNLRGLVRGFDGTDFTEDLDALALNYGPFVDFLALTRYVFSPVFSLGLTSPILSIPHLDSHVQCWRATWTMSNH